MRCYLYLLAGLLACLAGCHTPESSPKPMTYDLILRNGTLYDGSGGAPIVGDVALRGDRIEAVGASVTSVDDAKST